jgi:Metallo-beta-lactamase superfamily
MKVWAFSAGGIDASARLMTGRGAFVGGYAVSLTCLLVSRPEGLVLVDTGWGSPTVVDPRRFPGTLFALTAGAPHAERGETALGRVRSLGMRAEDVTDVVLTHLDIDHVGGLADFPHARVHVCAGEQLLLHAGDAFVHHAELDGEDDLPLGVRLYRRVLHEDKPSAQATLARLRALRRERADVMIVNAHDATLLGRLPTFPATVAG